MIPELIYTILIAFICLISGNWIFKLFNLKLSFEEELIFSFALGIAFIGYSTLILGLLGLLYKSVFLFLFFVLIIFCSKEAKLIYKKFLEFPKPNIKICIISLLIFLFLLLNFIGALAPPTGWDTQIYHLTSQKIYLSQHEINYIPLSHSDLPALGDMFILLGILIKNDILSKLLFFFVFLVLVSAIYVFSKKYFNKKIASLSVLIFLSLPLIIYYASTVYTDMFLSLFMLLAVFSFFEYAQDKNPSLDEEKKWLMLSAVFTGLSFSTKITAIIILITFFLIFFVKFLFAQERKKIFIFATLFFLIVAGISCIWFIKAFLYTGNPVYPVAYGIFGGPQNLSYTTEYTMKQLATGGFGRNFFAYLSLPWDITKNGYKFLSSFSLSPLFLLFLPLLLFVRKNNILKFLLLFSFFYLTLWFIIHPYLMKIIPLLSILSIMTSYAILKSDEKELFFKFIWIFILGTFIFSLLMSGLIYKSQFKVAIGSESRESYLSKNLQIFDTFNYSNNNLNKTDKILTIGEARYYYLDMPFQEGDPARQGVIDYRYLTEQQLNDWIISQNITHILVNRNYFVNISDIELNLYGYTKYSSDLIENFLKENTEQVYESNDVYLYEII